MKISLGFKDADSYVTFIDFKNKHWIGIFYLRPNIELSRAVWDYEFPEDPDEIEKIVVEHTNSEVPTAKERDKTHDAFIYFGFTALGIAFVVLFRVGCYYGCKYLKK